jgi:hypothetical protein
VISLTERDRLITHGLLFCVPVLWLRSLFRLWPDTESGFENLVRRLENLCVEGLLLEHSAYAQAAAVERFYHWAPGMPAPDFGALGWALAKRWEQLEPRRVAFYTATEFASRHYGRTVRNPLKSISALAHNIGLGDVWAQLAVTDPILARSAWVSEEVVAAARGYGEKVVDACLVDSTSTPALAIEFAGYSYAASNGARLREIHDDCSGRGIAYEMWTVSNGEMR